MTAYADRVQEITYTVGTGTIVLSGAVSGYQTFTSAFASGVTVYYCITDGIHWEVGFGVFTSGGSPSITRATVLSSSNAGSLVNFVAPLMNVFCTMPASRAGGPTGAGGDAVFQENANTITTSYTITPNANAIAKLPIYMNNGVVLTLTPGSSVAFI